ncbi:hypothetical protein [Curtobacterium sp. Leaf261]|uniref:hypothetical protein n=1 Tax=Curtobacterium sp. Leaf261 TaxID=1736311 RepID=UPI0006FBFDFE|nr:hypothetical protein [Curtobacterium sp. Leaf261]KQO63413.1 hypothetical protein ASF23_03885 [Curtobacterium sp. Leaf261]
MDRTSIDSSAAKSEWLHLSKRIEATQNFIGGDWEFIDSNARDCGDGGVQWVIGRIGPGVPAAERRALFDEVEAAWKANGWDPVRTHFGGDAPGEMLRYPASGVMDDGFYVEFDSTVHATTMGAQTPCAAGDGDQLAKEQFADNNTPGRTPSATPTP